MLECSSVRSYPKSVINHFTHRTHYDDSLKVGFLVKLQVVQGQGGC